MASEPMRSVLWLRVHEGAGDEDFRRSAANRNIVVFVVIWSYALILSAHRCYSLVRGEPAGCPLRELLRLVWRLACDYGSEPQMFTSLRPPLLYVSKWGAGWLPAGERSDCYGRYWFRQPLWRCQ